MKKLFELKVTDIYQAQKLIDQNWPTKIITLLGPTMSHKPDIQSTGSHHLRITCDDVTMSLPKWIAPNSKHVEQILSFSKNWNSNDKVLIHCRGGISRSTSCAIGILVQHGLSPEHAFEFVQSLSKDMDPNELILSFMDYQLGCKLSLLDYYHEWAKTQYHVINFIPKAYGSMVRDNARELYDLWEKQDDVRKHEDGRH
jgi:predicted protein tyrosine phosphatase